jgi:hypothetical protein
VVLLRLVVDYWQSMILELLEFKSYQDISILYKKQKYNIWFKKSLQAMF